MATIKIQGTEYTYDQAILAPDSRQGIEASVTDTAGNRYQVAVPPFRRHRNALRHPILSYRWRVQALTLPCRAALHTVTAMYHYI